MSEGYLRKRPQHLDRQWVAHVAGFLAAPSGSMALGPVELAVEFWAAGRHIAQLFSGQQHSETEALLMSMFPQSPRRHTAPQYQTSHAALAQPPGFLEAAESRVEHGSSSLTLLSLFG